MIEVNQIIQGDCLEVLKSFPDKSIDLILTDPPYGKNADKGSGGFGVKAGREYVGDWDSEIPPKEYFDEILRVSKHQIIFGGNYFAHLLPPSNCWIVWDKKGSASFKNPFADCELAWTSFTRTVKKYTVVQQGFVSQSKDERVHPTQKPTELFEAIVRDFSKSGDLVCDPFLGSGTTTVVCKQESRNYIGIEKDEGYAEIARKRTDGAIQYSLPLAA